jgi:hypothetical protein
MTSDGSRYGAPNNMLQRALADGDLNRVMIASKELPRVRLHDAAKILFLMARNQDRRFEKACARWLSRYASEAKDVSPDQLAAVADALVGLPDHDAAEVLLSATEKMA